MQTLSFSICFWPWCLSWQSSTARARAWHPSSPPHLLLKGQTLFSGLLFICLPGFYIPWGQDNNFDLILLTGSWISKLAVPTGTVAYSAVDPVLWALVETSQVLLTSKHFSIGFNLLSHRSSIHPLAWRRQRTWHHVLYFCWKILNTLSEIINWGKLGREINK